MRYATYEVPKEVLAEFAEELVNRELSNCIKAVNDDDEIVIQVDYEKDEESLIDELDEIHANLLEQVYEDEEEDDDDDK